MSARNRDQPITPYWAQAEVDELRGMDYDPERMHAVEDQLHVDVLRSIAEGCDDPAGLAAIALQTKDIRFSRWCA